MIHLTIITVIIGVMAVNFASNRSARLAAFTAVFIWAAYSVMWFAFVFRGPLFRGGF